MIALYIFLGILVLSTLVFLIFLFLIKPRPLKNRPQAADFLGKEYAHRGLHDANIPENSLRAFQAAVDRGLGIEMDLQLSADGEVVVVHDFDLNRVAGLKNKVKDLTAEELGRVSLNGKGDGIPTLKQALQVVDGEVPLIIEMKIPGMDCSVCAKAMEILDQYDGPYCVESFHPFAIRWMKKNRPRILRGQLSTDFFGHKEQGSKIQLFAVKNLLLNFLAKPDFIAYDIRYPNAWAFRLCCRIWNAIPIGWTIRTKEELEAAKKNFDAWICEDIY